MGRLGTRHPLSLSTLFARSLFFIVLCVAKEHNDDSAEKRREREAIKRLLSLCSVVACVTYKKHSILPCPSHCFDKREVKREWVWVLDVLVKGTPFPKKTFVTMHASGLKILPR
jgi:hypothetical protein